MRAVAQHTLDLVKVAEAGGFRDRLGGGASQHRAYHRAQSVHLADPLGGSYQHDPARHGRRRRAVLAPLRLASEAALCDLLSGGRLEFGISRGAFQYEFDRMAGGIPQRQGVAHVKEIRPPSRRYGARLRAQRCPWRFPRATSVPKPVQQPHPPIWIAARDPGTFEFAVEQGADVMATPLSRPHAEVGTLGERFQATMAKFPGARRPRFLILRRTCVYRRPEEWRIPFEASINHGRRFETLFRNIGGVENGFPEPTDLTQLAERAEYQPDAIRDAMMFGTPDEVVAKLKSYEEAGVDHFYYVAIFGLDPAVAMRSLELFITEVMPHFADPAALPGAACPWL